MTEETRERDIVPGRLGRASWMAWSLAGLSLAIFVISIALDMLARSASHALGGLPIYLPFLTFPLIGAMISSRHPRNPIGWICLAVGIFWMLIFFSDSYSAYGLAEPGSVPFPVTIHALLYAWVWVPAVGLLGTYMILLFPDGRLPSRRWRPVAWLSGATISLTSVVSILIPGPLEGLEGVRNPFGLEGQPWLVDAGYAVLPLLPLCMLASAISLVLRYRRASGEVREQIKWIAFAASFVGLMYLAIMSGGVVAWLTSPGTPDDLGTRSLWGALLENVMVLSFVGIPVAIGFAVLKYRLYDIDVIINRTLVYGSLTLMLALVYLGGVVSSQYAFRSLTGQESQLAVVASTLAIAALFAPLRRRVQSFVDRRFYRSSYDARKTLEAFSAGLRDETDLEALNEGLVGVVARTMQPEHVSLWLRPEKTSGHQQAGRLQRSQREDSLS